MSGCTRSQGHSPYGPETHPLCLSRRFCLLSRSATGDRALGTSSLVGNSAGHSGKQASRRSRASIWWTLRTSALPHAALREYDLSSPPRNSSARRCVCSPTAQHAPFHTPVLRCALVCAAVPACGSDDLSIRFAVRRYSLSCVSSQHRSCATSTPNGKCDHRNGLAERLSSTVILRSGEMRSEAGGYRISYPRQSVKSVNDGSPEFPQMRGR